MNFRAPMAAIAALAALGACSDPPPAPPGPEDVAQVTMGPDSTNLEVGLPMQLIATARNAAGSALNRTLTFTTSDASRATVSSGGLVTPVGVGRVVITATFEQKKDTTVIHVVPIVPRDAVVTEAQVTQAIQAADGSIPTVLNGLPAVVNVLVQCTPACVQGLRVVLRLHNADSSIVRVDTLTTGIGLASTPTFANPAVQFLLAPSDLVAGRKWQVQVDPAQTLVGDTVSNNRFPRSSLRALAVATVPDLKVRFVPIVLSAHNNTTATITGEQFFDYLRILKSVLPLAVVTPTIGSAFTTSTSFGVAPAGGASSFWTSLLSQLDAARVADPTDPQTHWFGLVLPPSGFNFTQFGGFAYIPGNGSATGVSTRTALAVQLGWFTDTLATIRLVAHELGHNFGRLHAPCGSPANPDPNFPNAGATIGAVGHNVYLRSIGTTSVANAVAADTRDVMSYCSPVWTAPYTYQGVLNFRTPVIALHAEPRVRARVLLVRGSVQDDRDVTLEPTFVLDGWPSTPERVGRYQLRGYAADGRVILSHDFEPARIDHAPDVGHFAFAIPSTPAFEASLARIEVIGPSGRARLDRPRVSTLSAEAASVVRVGGDWLDVRCGGSARGVMVQETGTGRMLAMGSANAIRVAARDVAGVTVSCSDAVGTARWLR